MLSINGPEFLVIVVIALIVIGPERLPHYAQQLGRAVRELRRMALGARDQVKAELGDEFEDLDWQKLDPRQYDPRRIVREALSDVWEDEPVAAPAARTSTVKTNPNQKSSAASRGSATKAAAAASAGAASMTKPAARPGARPGGGASRPGDAEGPAPFDLEAT